MSIEFFFDIGSPYTYLASTQIAALEERSGQSVTWRTFLLGGVFKSVGNQMPATVQGKAEYMLKDLHRWADRYGIPFSFSPYFPINSLLPMRALTGMSDEERPEAALRIFRAYWAEGLNPSIPEVLTGLIGAEAVARAESPEVKAALRANTDDAVSRGAFGAPTFFFQGEMYFGNDRMMFLEDAIQSAAR